MIGIYIIIGLIVFIVLYVIIIFNNLIDLNKRVERSRSVIDVYLKKRYDLIPNLVEVVKGYCKYEKETLERITLIRNDFSNNYSEKNGNELNNYYKELLATLEAYPEIKAGDSFMSLQKNLVKVEDELQAARRIYINNITTFNTKVESIPSNIIAKILRYKTIEMPKFIVEDININFDNN